MNAQLTRKVDQTTTRYERKYRKSKRHLKKYAWVYAILGGCFFGAIAAVFLLNGLNDFYNKYELYIRSPFQNPVVFRSKEAGQSAVLKEKAVPEPTKTPQKRVYKPSDIEIAKMVKAKSWDYSTAIRVAKSEDFWNLTKSFDCTRTHVNANGSTDYGLFQINSIHEKRLVALGMKMTDMLDCQKNINFAHDWIYNYSGWGAWSAFTNGSYLNHESIII